MDWARGLFEEKFGGSDFAVRGDLVIFRCQLWPQGPPHREMYLLSDFERAHDELLAPYWSLDWLRKAGRPSGGQHPLRPRRGGTSIKGSWPGGPGGGAPRGGNSGFSLLQAFFTRGGVAARPAQATLHVSALCGAS